MVISQTRPVVPCFRVRGRESFSERREGQARESFGFHGEHRARPWDPWGSFPTCVLTHSTGPNLTIHGPAIFYFRSASTCHWKQPKWHPFPASFLILLITHLCLCVTSFFLFSLSPVVLLITSRSHLFTLKLTRSFFSKNPRSKVRDLAFLHPRPITPHRLIG